MQKAKQTDRPVREILKCTRWGNGDRFVQFSSYEADLIDGNGNHLHLLHSEIDRWECAACGSEVEWSEVAK